MRNTLSSLVLFVTLVSCGGAQDAQIRVADGIGRSVNAALPTVVAQYRAEGNEAIRVAPTQEDAREAIAAVNARWHLVWGECGARPEAGCQGGAYHAFSAAHDAWATSLENSRRGSPVPLERQIRIAADLRETWCALRHALPVGATLPNLPNPVECPAVDASR